MFGESKGRATFTDYIFRRSLPESEAARLGMPPEELATVEPLEPIEQDTDTTSQHLFRKVAIGAGKIALNTVGAVVGAGIALHVFPYKTELAGVSTEISISTGTDVGLNADTTLGNFKYPNVDGLPLGLHITPQEVGVADIRNVSDNSTKFAAQAEKDFRDQLADIELHFALVIAAGGVVGAGTAEALRRALGNRHSQIGHLKNAGHMGLRAMAGVTAMAVGAGAYGVASYNPEWQRSYEVTGLLADIKAVPGKLADLYAKDTTAAKKVQTLIALDEQLTSKQEKEVALNTAYNVMFISDMHLRNMYPYITQMAKEKNVKVVINTGDESEFGMKAELTPEYIAGIRELAKQTTFIWVAGNHDSPEVLNVMRSIPGVIVLGDKIRQPDHTFVVSGKYVSVYGLNVLGVPDPRVFGGEGVYGADDSKQTDPLEHQAIDRALKGFDPSTGIDIAATHEPVVVPDIEDSTKARLMAAGHYHHQNDPKTIESLGYIYLNEGSTGMGGLTHYDSSPMEFSIMSVAPDCQFTEVTRYQLSNPVATDGNSDAKIATYALKPQKISKQRVCSTDLGVGQSVTVNGTGAGSVDAIGKPGK